MKEVPSSSNTDQVLNFLLEKKLLQIIVASVTETVENYTHSPVSTGMPQVLTQPHTADIRVGGGLRLDSGGASIELFLGFSRELFSWVYDRVFDNTIDEITAENHDLPGEFLNVAFGVLDPKFREKGFHYISSLPEGFSGEKLVEVLAGFKGKVILIPCSMAGHSFFLQISSAGFIETSWRYDGDVQLVG
jgi:hypothetical protein